MKIVPVGKSHLEGIAKKTGKPYNFNQIHYLGKSRGVEGQAALQLMLDPKDYPLENIELNKPYEAEFDNRGYLASFIRCN